MSSKSHVHVIFRGRVQGVGFRWTVVEHAEALGLVGSVKNVPDGTVEMHGYGAKEALEKCIESILQAPGIAHIAEHTITFDQAQAPLPKEFTIIRE